MKDFKKRVDGETVRSSPESFIFREKPLLPVSSELQDTFKSHISSSMLLKSLISSLA